MNAQHHSKRTRRSAFALRVALAGSLLAPSVQAQIAPDAGQTLEPLKRIPEPQRSAPMPQVEAPRGEALLPGGTRVTLRRVEFSGNTVFDAPALSQAIASLMAEPLDLAGLRGLADRVSALYQQAGYPFARAYLPPQALADGVLRLEVLEGRYGRIRAVTDDVTRAAQAEVILVPLKPGDLIETKALERATLLLGDQPGIGVTPVLKPGSQVGTGDLDVEVSQLPPVSGGIGLDNQGNRYSGRNRLQGSLDWSSPFRLGDLISLRALVSDEKLWLGSLAYGAPLGGQGLRLNLSYAHTHYELGGVFASADANGHAKVTSTGLSYPLLRSNASNLKLSLAAQFKQLRDDKAGTSESKSSRSLPLTLDFDHRDGFAGGGVSYGSVGVTAGSLRLGDDASDLNRTRGHFTKINLDLLRLQNLPGSTMLYGRFSAQRTNHNLDSSERISLGGAGGIRAYPNGEAVGDEGWLLQLEFRQPIGDFAPYVFVDNGHIRIDRDPVAPSADNRRNLGGAGFGTRYAKSGWSFDVAVAWRTRGGPPEADPARGDPRLWLSLNKSL